MASSPRSVRGAGHRLAATGPRCRPGPGHSRRDRGRRQPPRSSRVSPTRRPNTATSAAPRAGRLPRGEAVRGETRAHPSRQTCAPLPPYLGSRREAVLEADHSLAESAQVRWCALLERGRARPCRSPLRERSPRRPAREPPQREQHAGAALVAHNGVRIRKRWRGQGRREVSAVAVPGRLPTVHSLKPVGPRLDSLLLRAPDIDAEWVHSAQGKLDHV
jgi:hypothetical protein